MALPFDSTLKFGSATAREKGRKLDAVSRNKLKDLLGDGPYCYDYGPLDVVDSTGKTPTVRVTCVQTVYVSSVTEGNDYVTYKFVPGVNEWVETDPVLHKPTALVGVLYREYLRYKHETEDLKSKLSQLQLEHSLLRHDYERVRPSQKVKGSLSLATKLLLGLLLGSLLAHTTFGHKQPGSGLQGECLDMDVVDGKQTCINFLPKNDTEETPVGPAPALDFDWKFYAELLYALTPYLLSWPVVAVVVGTIYVAMAEQPVYMLVTLLLATYSRAQLLALAGLPFMDMASVVTLWTSMFCFSIHRIMSIWIMGFLVILSLLIGVFMPDVKYADLVRGQLTVVAVMLVNYLCVTLEAPDWVIFTMVVVYRIFRVTYYIFSERVEVRGPDGKVVETRASMPAWLNKASKFFQARFAQKVRTGIAPTARVIPDGVLYVETQDGLGTGFRCRNYIVTAGHVASGSEAPKLRWAGVTAYTKVVHRPAGKDIAFLSLPAEMQDLPSYRLAKSVEDGVVVITSLEESGALAVAVTEGVVVGDSVTYAVQTRNGMSGSPVTNADGRILAVHQTNTGFTGGGVILTEDDFPQPKKSAREAQLEARIKELEEAMNQSYNQEDLVDLVRTAVAREFKILRAEVAKDPAIFSQAKGKNKKGHRRRGGKKRRAIWSEEEYKELLEKGFTRSQLKEMADTLRHHEDDPLGSDTESEGGYPEWSDVSDVDEIEREWFGQSWDDYKPVKEEPQDTLPIHIRDKYGVEAYLLGKDEIRAFATELKSYTDKLEALIDKTIQQGKWLPSVNPTAIIEELNDLWFNLNMLMWEKGLVPFTQRRKLKKRQPKNLQRGPKRAPSTTQ